MDEEIEEARDRMQDIFDEYKEIIKAAFDSINCTMKDLVLDSDGKPALITKSRTYNTFTRKSNYSITGTNDPEEGEVRHEYRSILSGDQDWLQSSEDGEIIGNGKRVELQGDQKTYPAYKKALAFWNNLNSSNEIDNRLKDLINDMSNYNNLNQNT